MRILDNAELMLVSGGDSKITDDKGNTTITIDLPGGGRTVTINSANGSSITTNYDRNGNIIKEMTCSPANVSGGATSPGGGLTGSVGGTLCVDTTPNPLQRLFLLLVPNR